MLTFNEADHTYYWNGNLVPNVTNILSSAGLVDDRWFDDYSRDRGKAVHRATELYDRGTLDEDSLDPVLVPYLDAHKLFLLETGAVWDSIEDRLYHEIYGYAGTLDRTGIVSGRKVLVDLKSGQKSRATAIQTAAYAAARGVMCDRMEVRLMDTGKYSITSYKIKDQMRDFQVFQACLTVSNWKENG